MMKKLELLILLLFLITLSINAFSQDYKWRNKSTDDLEFRWVKESNYEDFQFKDKVDFRNAIFKSKAAFSFAEFDSIADFSDAHFYSITDFEHAHFQSLANFSKVHFDSKGTFSMADFYLKADFSGTRFDSLANFFSTSFRSEMDFSEANFYYKADFPWVDCQSLVNFSKARFYSRADFSEGYFDSLVDFSKVVFKSDAGFSEASFFSEANFSEVRFNSKADFTIAYFFSKADFHKASFDSLADFAWASFDSIANFSEANFYSKANFLGSQIDSIADFSNVEFYSKADFIFTEFDSIADFSHAQFRLGVDFSAATLPYYLNLSYIDKISGRIDLTESYINPGYDTCYVNLYGSDASKIKLRYKGFKLDWPETSDIISIINESYKDKEDSIIKVTTIIREVYDTKIKIYEDLLDFHKTAGYARSYEILDKEFKQFKYTDDASPYGLWMGGFIMFIDKYWWGYGYDKGPVIRNIILIYLLFSLINAFLLKHLTKNVYDAPKINEWWNEVQGSKISTFLKSIPFSLFYTAQIFFGFKFDVEKLKFKENLQGIKNFNLIYFFVMYVGGLICLLYLLNFALKF